jgi:hypothetical protein
MERRRLRVADLSDGLQNVLQFLGGEAGLTKDGAHDPGAKVSGVHGDGHVQVPALQLEMASNLPHLIEPEPLQRCDQPFRFDTRHSTRLASAYK